METAKHGLTALDSRLRRYIKLSNAKTLFSKEPYKVYSQLQCNNTKPNSTRKTYERKIIHVTPLPSGHRNLPEQGTADITQWVKNWTAPSPDMIHTCWLKSSSSGRTPTNMDLLASMTRLPFRLANK